MLSSTDCDSGTSGAPKTPCSRRNATICVSDTAAPHSIEVTMKPMTAVRNSGLRPNLASSQPVAGVMIAAATI